MMDLLRWFRCLRKPAHTAPIAKARLQACPAPITRPKLTDAGKLLIAESEGLRLQAYKCSAGKWTIGYGATRGTNGSPVKEGDVVTIDDAISMFDRDVRLFSGRVERMISVTVTDNQFSAVVSLAYNIGPAALLRSKLLEKLNAGNYSGAAGEFWDFRNARDPITKRLRVIPGLVTRRALEKELFLA